MGKQLIEKGKAMFASLFTLLISPVFMVCDVTKIDTPVSFFTWKHLLLILGISSMISHLPAQAAPDYWSDIDFAAPLETEIIQEELRGDILVTRLRYTSHKYNGQTIRVYAIYGRPAEVENKVPGLLHIHGGTQTASLEDVLFFAKRGYAVLSFDWTGPTNRRGKDITTSFPASVGSNSNGSGMKNGKVWHIVTMARRGIFLLSRRSGVDAERLGVYGISWGGFSTWLVNAMEPRLKAAVSIYGIGTALKNEADGWHAELLPVHYADAQKSPMAFLDGTNDFFGQLPVLQEVMPKVSTENRLSLTPNENHGLDSLAKETGYRWLDHYLKDGPALAPAPELSVQERNGNLIACVRSPNAESCILSFACGDKPFITLYWNQRTMHPVGNDSFETAIPATVPPRTVRCIAHAIYPEGYRLSTLMKTLAPSDFPEENETPGFTDVLFTPADGANAWYQSYPGGAVMFTPNDWQLTTGPSGSDGRLCLIGHRNGDVFSPLTAYLRAPGDPRRPADKATGISIEFNAAGIKAFTLRVFNTATPDGNVLSTRPLTCYISVKGKQGWTRVVVKKGDLQGDKPLSDFATVHEFGIVIQAEPGVSPEVGEIRWVHD